MRIYAVANQKGGVGKTTTAVNLSHALANLGRRTLLIDLDPQANATSALGLEPKEGCSLYEVLQGRATVSSKIVELAENLAMIPAEIDLAGSEVEIARLPNHLTRVREVLHQFREVGGFRFCFIDCPPSVGILMTNALAAADGVIVPIQCEYFALEGLSKILQLIEQIRAATEQDNLRLEGILMTMFDARTRLSQQVVEDVNRYFPQQVFKTIIPRSIRLAEAPSHGKSIFSYDPNGVGARVYDQLAREFLERVEQRG